MSGESSAPSRCLAEFPGPRGEEPGEFVSDALRAGPSPPLTDTRSSLPRGRAGSQGSASTPPASVQVVLGEVVRDGGVPPWCESGRRGRPPRTAGPRRSPPSRPTSCRGACPYLPGGPDRVRTHPAPEAAGSPPYAWAPPRSPSRRKLNKSDYSALNGQYRNGGAGVRETSGSVVIPAWPHVREWSPSGSGRTVVRGEPLVRKLIHH